MASPVAEIRNHNLALSLIVAAALIDLVFDVAPNTFGEKRFWFCWTGHCFTKPTYDQYGEQTWDGKLYLSTVLYYGCEHISLILILWAAYLRPAKRIFLIRGGIEFLDLVEYGITYNTTYVTLDHIYGNITIPIEFGLFKTLAIVLFVMREYYGRSVKNI